MKWMTRGDIDGFFGLALDNLVQLLVIDALCRGVLGFPVELVIPANVSVERRQIIEAYGAKPIESDPLEGSDGAIRLCREIIAADPERYFKPDQYFNEANPLAHYSTTGPEIWEQTCGRVTHFLAGIGTSGTIMGTGRYLKERNPAIQVLAVEPDDAFHGLEGLKHMASSIVPGIYHEGELDGKVPAPTDEAYEMVYRIGREEGLLVGEAHGGAQPRRRSGLAASASRPRGKRGARWLQPCQRFVLRYLSPKSGKTTTMSPLSIVRAICSAAQHAAPADWPTSRPSSRPMRYTISYASSVGAGIFPSSSFSW